MPTKSMQNFTDYNLQNRGSIHPHLKSDPNMELIKNISVKTLIPFVLAFVAILTFHFSVDLTTDDYKYFRIYAFGYYEQGDVLSFMRWRYATWTSRVLIEFFTFWFVQYPTWVFSIVNSLIILAIVAMTYKLFSKKTGFIYATVAILLSFMYRITDQGSAGYLVTMIGYLWVMVAFLPTLFPFKQSFGNGVSYQWHTYVVCALCALLCCNCEQICVTAIMMWGMFILYTYFQTKRIDPLYCTLLLIALGHLVTIMTCPGNAERTVVEISRMPVFEQYTFLRKVVLCVAAPVAKYMLVSKQSIIVWAFSVIVPLTLFLKNKKISIPLFVSLIPLGLLCFTLVKQYPIFDNYQEATARQLALICATSIAFYGSILFSLFYIGKDNESVIAKYGPLYIFFVGFISRACIGITVSFMESARTFFMLEYAMIAISILFVSKHISDWRSNSRA